MPPIHLPVLSIIGQTLPEVWEKSVIQTWEKGSPIKTEYDNKDDPPSRDASVVLCVEDPLKEPRIHKAIPADYGYLETYRQEVINGAHDHWVKKYGGGPDDETWDYTYHQRVKHFNIDNIPPRMAREGDYFVNQLNYVVEKLCQAPHTRRAQATTWNVYIDPTITDPPCLQRLWFRIYIDENGVWWLCLNTHWRSRDAYKAAFINMWGMISWMEEIAQRVGQQCKVDVSLGRYVEMIDSYHIYGSYFTEFKDKFLEPMKKRTFKDRVVRSDSPIVLECFESARTALKAEREAESK